MSSESNNEKSTKAESIDFKPYVSNNHFPGWVKRGTLNEVKCLMFTIEIKIHECLTYMFLT